MGNGKDILDRAADAIRGVGTSAVEGLQKIGDKAGDALVAAGRLFHPKDTSVPSFSLYIAEHLGIQNALDSKLDKKNKGTGQIMGVYVPPAVKSLDKVNVILYMHGDKVRIVKSDFTIREYWSLAEMPLRQGLNASGQPYILLAPTLGPDADTQFGTLGSQIDYHLEWAMTQLYRYGPPDFTPPKPPKIGDLIIAGHSGAFGPISSILANMKTYKSNVKEIWGFDIMYGSTASKLQSVQVPVYAYYVDTAEKSRGLAAQKKPNIFVMKGVDFYMEKGKEKTKLIHHDLLMQRFWFDRLQRIGTNGTHPDDQKRL